MADYNLGTAKGKIELDASGAVTGAAQANAAISSIDTESRKASGGAAALGASMVGVGAVALGGFGLAVKAAADFEQQLSGIKAVSNATEGQMDSLRKKALQLGADTSFSAGEAALSMEELVKAGLSVDDVLNGAADATVALAAAGEVDLATAATIASNAMNQFGLSAEQMPRVADLIAGAANASAIDVNDFGMSLAQAGATANLIGLSFDDLALAITAMGNAGIKGSDAGTSLKTFLSNLQPTTEKQKDLFDELGLSIEANATAMNETGNAFFDAQGKIKPMEEIAGTLATALEGMSDAQKTATLEALFGSDAIRAAAIIAGEGAGGFQELAGAMNEVTAADVAATRLDNFNGSIEQLKGSFETFLITAGTPFLGFLREIVDHLTEAVNWMSQLDEKTLKYITAGVALAGVVLTISGGLLLLGKALGPVAQGLMLIRSAIAAIGVVVAANPIGILVAALVAAGAAIYYFYNNNEGFRKFIDNLIDKAIEFGKAVQEWFVDTAIPAMQALWEAAQPILQNIASFVTDTVIPALQQFGDFIMNTLVPAVVGGFQAVMDGIGPVIEWLKSNVFATLFEVGNALFVAFLRIGDVLNATVVPAVQMAWDLITAAFSTAVDVIGPIIGVFIDGIVTAWNLFGDNIVSAVQLAWNVVKTIIETVLGLIRGIAQVFIGIFTGDMDKFLEGIKTLWNTVWDAIKSAFSIVWDAMKLVVENVTDAIHLAIDTAWNAVRTVFDTVWEGIKSAFQRVWDALSTTVSTVTGTIKSTIDTFTSGAQSVWETATGAIETAWNTLWDAAESTVQGAIDVIDGIFSGLESAWRTIWNGIKTAISTPINAIKSVIDGIAGAVNGAIGAIDNLIGKIRSIPSPASIADKVTPWDGLVPGFAIGGIVSGKMLATVGEAGPEAIIPMDGSTRAMNLLHESGLAQQVLAAYGMPASAGSYSGGMPASAPAPAGSGGGIEVHGDVIINDGVDWDMFLMQADAELGAMA